MVVADILGKVQDFLEVFVLVSPGLEDFAVDLNILAQEEECG